MQGLKTYHQNLVHKLGTWVEQTTKLLIKGTYYDNEWICRLEKGELTLPEYIQFDRSCTELWRLEEIKDKIDKNFTYICRLGFDMDHLIDYYNVQNKSNKPDVSACEIAMDCINDYSKFIKECLFSDRYKNVLKKNNKFCLPVAQLVYNEKWGDFYEIMGKLSNSNGKGKKFKKLDLS